MTTSIRTYRTVIPGTQYGNPSDVNTWSTTGTSDPVAAVHQFYPNPATLVATQPGARLHLLGYADTIEGQAPQAAIIASPAETLPPDIEGPLGTPGWTYTNDNAFSQGAKDPDKPIFFAIDVTIPNNPDGIIYDGGEATVNGPYVGFVDGNLRIYSAGMNIDFSQSSSNLGLDNTSGTLYLSINGNTGRIQLDYLKDGATTVVNVVDVVGSLSDWKAADFGRFSKAYETVALPAVGATSPLVRDISGPLVDTGSTVELPPMCTHEVGDKLYLVLTIATAGTVVTADPSVSGGWTQIHAYRGVSGVHMPAIYVLEKTATSNSTPVPTMTLTGFPQPTWQRTVAFFSVEDATSVVIDDATRPNGNGNPTTKLDYPAGNSTTNALNLYLLSTNSNTSTPLNPPGTEFGNNTPEVRGQAWGDRGDDGSALINFDVDPHDGVATGIVMSFSPSGTIADNDFNGTFTEARIWEDQEQPSNMYDPGIYVPEVIGTPAQPAIPHDPGTLGASYTEIEQGSFLESVRVRLSQSRTGGGIWNAQLFTLDDTGNPVYGPAVAPLGDTSTDGTSTDVYTRSQSSLNDGTLWHDITTAGRPIGVLLEAVTVSEDSAFGTAALDIASIEMQWIQAPTITVTSPVDNTILGTATPSIGWNTTDGIQSAYRVRIWTADTYIETQPEAGHIVYDSGRILSATDRSHQITRPLLPSTKYVMGLQIESGNVNGRTHASAWQTLNVTAPTPPGTATTRAFADFNIDAQPNADGTVTITGAHGIEDPLETQWAMIERATGTALDTIRTSQPYKVLESIDGRNGNRGWLAQAEPAILTPIGQIKSFEIEWFGNIPDFRDNSTNYLIGAVGIIRLCTAADGRPFVIVEREDPGDPNSFTTHTSWTTVETADAAELQERWNGREIGLRIGWNFQTGERYTLHSFDNGETWEDYAAPGNATSTLYDQFTGNCSYFLHGFGLSAGLKAGNRGYTRRAKIRFNDNTTILDIDVDRDATSLDPDSLKDPVTGIEYVNPRNESTYITEIGPKPSQPRRSLATVEELDVENSASVRTGIYADGNVLSSIQDRTIESTTIEWWGKLVTPAVLDDQAWAFLALTDAYDFSFGFGFFMGTTGLPEVWILTLNQSDQYNLFSTRTPVGQRLGIRVDLNNFYPITTYSTDNGRTWNTAEFLGSSANPYGPIKPVRSLYIDKENIVGDLDVKRHTTESFKWIDTIEGETILDIDFQRDIDDLETTNATKQFVDKTGQTWTLSNDAKVVERPSMLHLNPTEIDDVWQPVAPLRDATIAQRKVEYVDLSPPQNETLHYRIRPISEPQPTFESTSYPWTYSTPVTVTANAWKLSTIDGRLSVPLHPDQGVSWSKSIPSIVSAPLSASKYVVHHDQIKARQISISVTITSQAEHDDLSAIIATQETLIVSDLHGNVGMCRIVGQIPTLHIVTAPDRDEHAPVGRTYRVGLDLVEVMDPRDFGYGTNAKAQR